MNVAPRPTDPPWWQSKKLAALVVGILAILVLVVIAVIWAVDKTIIVSAFTSITTLVSTHLLGQTGVDRAQAYSPNYPYNPPASSAPPDVRVP